MSVDTAPAATTSTTSPRRRARRGPPHGLISIVLGLTLWELWVRVFQPNALIVAAPSEIYQEFISLVTTGVLWPHFRISMTAFVVGYVACAAIAIPLALVMGSNRWVRTYLDPWMTALYTAPNVALAPIFIITFGFGLGSKIAVVVLSAFFPMLINTVSGVLDVDRDMRDLARVFEATWYERFFRIVLPAAMPFILTGMRLAVARALVGLVVADLFGARAGLGLLLLESTQLFMTARIFVVVLILVVIGIICSELIGVVERRSRLKRLGVSDN